MFDFQNQQLKLLKFLKTKDMEDSYANLWKEDMVQHLVIL